MINDWIIRLQFSVIYSQFHKNISFFILNIFFCLLDNQHLLSLWSGFWSKVALPFDSLHLLLELSFILPTCDDWFSCGVSICLIRLFFHVKWINLFTFYLSRIVGTRSINLLIIISFPSTFMCRPCLVKSCLSHTTQINRTLSGFLLSYSVSYYILFICS